MPVKAVLIRQRTHPSIPRRNPLERISEAISEHNPDMIIAPEYFLNHEKKVYAKEEKERIIEEICRISRERLIVPGTMLWHENGFMYNTGFMISDGRVIAEHDKAEVKVDNEIIGSSLGFKAGDKSGSVARWHGLDIGLEICCEHGSGALKRRGDKLDIQVVCSCGFHLEEANLMLRKGGYAILCDGQHMWKSEIRKKENRMLSPKYKIIIGEERNNALVYRLEAK